MIRLLPGRYFASAFAVAFLLSPLCFPAVTIQRHDATGGEKVLFLFLSLSIDCIFLFATMSADPSSEMSRLLWDNGRLLWGDAEQEGEEGAREREGGGDRSAHLSPRLGRVGSQGPLSS